MADRPCLLALDQGTTSSRAIAFTPQGEIVALAQQEFPQNYPEPGWVEHDPEILWATTLTTARQAFSEARAAGYAPTAIGVTNQRETTIVWDRTSGAAIGPAIVWQDRRTAPVCRTLAEAGHEPMVSARTGLVLDPYFSATKLAWLLDRTPGARARAEAGELCFGTVESFLIWRLTAGRLHVTDATNASRTLLFNIIENRWDDDLCALFRVPPALLPEVRDCAGDFGATDPSVFGASIPIRGAAGDQQAALIGQACFAPGAVKSTYGTGAFLVLNTGETAVRSSARLLSTVAYRLNGKITYAIEGSVLSAGATVQWLRDGLGLVARAAEIEALAAAADEESGVYLAPAFTGLGAPYWDPDARGALLGLTRGAGRAEIARAGLEATVYQTRDLFDAMAADGVSPRVLRVDGGMTSNGWLLQRLADICGVDVVRPAVTETTAFGAAALAGLGIGLYRDLEEIAGLWRADAQFTPNLPEEKRARAIAGWRDAISRVRTNA